jgi:putative nucleotidyltransferase with HDIG domain
MGTLAASIDVMTARLADQHLSTIRALTSAIDARDPYTAGHSIRVGQLALEMGRVLELPKRDLQFLEIGGYLHDVGKIGIRDDVLLKPGNLTPEERKMIEEHPTIGLKIIQYVDLPEEVLQFVGQHHEKLNGTGYPDGLDSQSLTMFPRIGAVADVYDALTTKRPYKPALTISQAVDMLKRDVANGLLDPRVIQALISVLPTWGRRLQLEPALQGFHIRELGAVERSA